MNFVVRAQCRRSSLFDHIGGAALSLNAPANARAGHGTRRTRPPLTRGAARGFRRSAPDAFSQTMRQPPARFFDRARRMR
ncbi:hypothetical protein BWU74_00645 [Paraburkholderia caledonica]|nr:hypothetical protein BWU74_00645 [Burkholderia sp. Bk]